MKTAARSGTCRATRAFFTAGLGVLLLALSARADDPRVVLVVDLTAAGQRIKPPTRDQPTYYYPIYFGYKELGGILDFYERRPASEAEVERILTEALAKQGYVPATTTLRPTLVLTFRWGTIAPQGFAPEVLASAQRRPAVASQESRPIIANADELHTYIAGTQWREIDRTTLNAGEIMSTDPHHYLMISALDFDAFNQQKDILLWRAHVSTTVWGSYLDEVLGTLIATAAPRLGRETKPAVISSPAVPAGRVIVGPSRVTAFPESSRPAR